MAEAEGLISTGYGALSMVADQRHIIHVL